MDIVVIYSIDDFVSHDSIDRVIVSSVVLGRFREDLGTRSEVQWYSKDVDCRMSCTILW
jgi:hypothetical protein